MNKTQDKFSLPAVALSIFAAARQSVCRYAVRPGHSSGRRCWLQYC